MTYHAHGEIAHGQLLLDDASALRAALGRFQPGPVTVVIQSFHATRSLEQNAYWWGVVIHALSEHTGYTPEEIHDAMKAMFLPKTVALMDHNGVVHKNLVIGGTTTRLTTIEFMEFMERVRMFAAEELGVIIPDPTTMDSRTGGTDETTQPANHA